MRGILAKSRAGKLSRFQTAKDNFFGEVGPGFTSTPARMRRVLITINRKARFLNGISVSSVCLKKMDIPRGTKKLSEG